MHVQDSPVRKDGYVASSEITTKDGLGSLPQKFVDIWGNPTCRVIDVTLLLKRKTMNEQQREEKPKQSLKLFS